MDIYRLERELISDEGWRSKAYKCSRGHWTIGVGHKLMPHEMGDHPENLEWDSAKIFDVLRSDAHLALRGCEMIFGRSHFWLFSENRQRALVNMCFQLGTDGLSKFKRMISAIFNGDWVQAHAEALDSRWARQTPARANRVAKLLLEG